MLPKRPINNLQDLTVCRYCGYWDFENEASDGWAQCEKKNKPQGSTDLCNKFLFYYHDKQHDDLPDALWYELYEFETKKPAQYTRNGKLYESKAYQVWKDNKEHHDEFHSAKLWMHIGRKAMEEYDIISLNKSRLMLVHTGNHYQFGNNIDFTRFVKKEIEDAPGKSTYESSKKDLLHYIIDSTLIERDDLCYEGYYMNFPNGHYNLKEGKFHDKKEWADLELPPIKFFYELPHAYKADKKYGCPKFKRALRMWLGTPFSVYRTRDIFEYIGLCMTVDISVKAAFLFYGPHDSGKTQLSNIINIVVGKDNISTTTLQELNNRFGTNEIEFKLLNKNADLPAKKLWDTGVFKGCTGGDGMIHGERKGGEKYGFPNSATFSWNANDIPPVEHMHDMAFFIRWVLFNFPNQFTSDMPGMVLEFWRTIAEDPDEIQGIIHAAIKGYQRVKARKGFRAAIRQNTMHIWNYNSSAVYAFLYDRCVRDPKGQIQVDEFYEAFNDTSPQGYSKNALTRELQKLKIYRKEDKRKDEYSGKLKTDYYYKGVRWREGEDLLNNFNIEGDITVAPPKPLPAVKGQQSLFDGLGTVKEFNLAEAIKETKMLEGDLVEESPTMSYVNVIEEEEIEEFDLAKGNDVFDDEEDLLPPAPINGDPDLATLAGIYPQIHRRFMNLLNTNKDTFIYEVDIEEQAERFCLDDDIKFSSAEAYMQEYGSIKKCLSKNKLIITNEEEINNEEI